MDYNPNQLYSKERLEALKSLAIMDTPYEEEYDEVVKLAVQLCGASSSVISLLDDSRQWYKAKIGVDKTETPAEESFCKYGIEVNEIFEVEDATLDERFADNPSVVCDNGVRFYAGTQLKSPSGYNVGMLCVMDTKPNKLTAEQRVALTTLGQQVVKQFELRSALNELDRQRKELEDLNRFKNRVFAVISHDLRSPIANIQQILGLYKFGDLTPDEFGSFVDTLDRQMAGTEAILTNLMAWANTQKPKLMKTNLHSLANQIILGLKLNLEVKRVTLEIDIDASLQSIMADQEGLQIVLRNLLSNAIKYSYPDQTISLVIKANGEFLDIKVSDQGRGIAEKDKPKLLDEGTFMTTFGTANEKGTGLGLLVCKSIVHHNGGVIEINSEENKGTTVHCTLRFGFRAD